MKGRIDEISVNELKGGRKYLTLSINGDKYSLWDKKYFETLQKGDLIEYEWRQSGNFRNITRIEVDPNTDPANYMDTREKHIVRMSCIKSAADILRYSDTDFPEKTDLALEAARKFEKYVTRDDYEREV